ncbi:MAG: hypothetical protein ACOC16_02150 [Nanoarchaeota archaeon]
MLIILFALVDIHTLFVLIFHEYLSNLYVFSGASFAILKGLLFFLPSRDLFSLLDIICGFFMLFLLITNLPNFICWTIIVYLVYKIIMSFGAIK